MGKKTLTEGKIIVSILGLLIGSNIYNNYAYAQTIDNNTEEKSISFDAVLTSDFMRNSSGGFARSNSVITNLDLTADWRGKNGFEAFGYIIADTGGGFTSNYVGDTQGASNIDAPSGVRLLEAWIKKTSANQKHTSTIGVINLNGIFDIQPMGGVFLNGSHGIGAEISQNGPSLFPISGLGWVEEYHHNENLTIRGAIFDATPGNPDDEKAFTDFGISKKDGALLIGEVENNFDDNTFKLGAWQYTNKFDTIDGTGRDKSQGIYAQFSKKLTKNQDAPEQGLGAWVRAGLSNDSVSNINRYLGGGLSYTGPLKSRPNDVAGFAISNAHFGSDYLNANPQPYKNETTY